MAVQYYVPDQNPEVGKNIYRVEVGAEDDSFEKGQALVTPPVSLSDRYLSGLRQVAGVSIHELYASDEGTLFAFQADSGNDTSTPKKQVDQTFSTLVNELGYLSYKYFLDKWKD